MVFSLLASDPLLIREKWIRMRVLYKNAVDLPPAPGRVAISTITEEQVELYWHVPSPGQPIIEVVQTFLAKKSTTEDKDIALAVCRLCLNCLGGPSRMQEEHLYQWLHEATHDDTPDSTNWKKVVVIVQI